MRCEEFDRYVNESDCIDCENRDCEEFARLTEKRDYLAKFHQTELVATVESRISDLFGLPKEKIDEISTEFVNGLYDIAKEQITNCIRIILKAEISKQFEQRSNVIMTDLFEKAVVAELDTIQDTDKVVKATAQEIVTGKIKEYLATTDRRGRKVVKETLDKAIDVNVSEKVDEAIEEIKTECLEKFNKAAMKKMMQGMATAIGNDQKLLTILTMKD